MDRLLLEALSNAGSEDAVMSSPADIFAISAKLAKDTGCYLIYASDEKGALVPPQHCVEDGREWLRALDQANHVRLTSTFIEQMPIRVRRSWSSVNVWRSKGCRRNVDGCLPKTVSKAVLHLIAAADEACGGLGLPDGGAKGIFSLFSNWRLVKRGTLCRFLGSSSVRVLPKQHAPKFGLNLRNLTHHLAFCENSEVGVKWNINPEINPGSKGIRASFNILIVPWPFVVLPSEVGPAKRTSSSASVGYFEFKPRADRGAVKSILKIVKSTQDIGQRVDVVVLPECSLAEAEWRSLSKSLSNRGISLLAGVAAGSANGTLATNSVRLKVPGSPGELLNQNKHHRWKIDQYQIKNYGLGGTLSCLKDWWENIEIKPREINFFAFSDDLVICPLICEDLARQDPVADVVRSIGPNLVVALLMDGPQLSNRWSARYASVLADDPGSSVLTLSSLGMVNISRPPNVADTRQVIASWREPTGGFMEISLPKDKQAALLNVQFLKEVEQTVDGRSDAGVASSPSLAGIHFI